MNTLRDLLIKILEPEFRLIFAFILSVISSFYFIPVILRIAHAKKLFDHPDDDRKNHASAVPAIGGFGFYVSITIIGLTMINSRGMLQLGSHISMQLVEFPAIVAGATILFFIGLKDDILSIPPYKKLIAEFLAMSIVIMLGNLRITNLHGMLGVYELTTVQSTLFTYLMGIGIINAFNLSDGIDGLASALAMLASSVFGLFFYLAGDYEYAILSAIIIGTNIPFFFYNVFGTRNKLFMGDAGSLILGFLMSLLVIRFNRLDLSPAFRNAIVSAPAFSLAILILPIFDTIRVFAIRILRGCNPFKADRRHIHHLLIDLGLTHFHATILLLAINLLFILFAFIFNRLGNFVLTSIILSMALLLTYIGIMMRRGMTSKKLESGEDQPENPSVKHPVISTDFTAQL